MLSCKRGKRCISCWVPQCCIMRCISSWTNSTQRRTGSSKCHISVSSLTQSFTYPSPTLTQSINHLPYHSLNHSFNQSFSHPLTQPFILPTILLVIGNLRLNSAVTTSTMLSCKRGKRCISCWVPQCCMMRCISSWTNSTQPRARLFWSLNQSILLSFNKSFTLSLNH